MSAEPNASGGVSAERALYRRALRRETHSSRTAPAVIAATSLTVVLLAASALVVWALVDPDVRAAVTRPISDTLARIDLTVAGVLIGCVSLAFAVLLVALALGPGRRSRRAVTTERVAMVVDDGVLADAVADAVADGTGVSRSQVAVRLGRRSIHVHVTPTSGVEVSTTRAANAATGVVTRLGLDLSARVTVADHGVIS